MKRAFTLLLLVGVSTFGNAQIKRDYSAQVDSLMSLMTLQEKIGQTVQFSGGWSVTGPTVSDVNEDLVKDGKIGSFLNLVTAKATRAIQKVAVEESRLGIPLLFGYDVIHGYQTIFPINLGISTSWDPSLVEKTSKMAAEEAASVGIHWTFAPMVDIARDPRWGRISEGSGEDTYLGEVMARAYVKGFQGDDLLDPFTIAACAKHYVAYGAALAGRDYNSVDMGDNELRNTYLPPFKAALDQGVRTFMTSFNVINDVPASGNEYTLRSILKGDWNFDGLVVSDYTSINEMIPHGYAADDKDAARLGFKAGVDMDMMGNLYSTYLEELITENEISLDLLNDTVKRILTLKFELGLFEDPYRYSNEQREIETIYRADIIETAKEAAIKSTVLLKNNQALPLDKTRTIALIGPLAKDESSIIGDWAAKGERDGKAVSVFEGISSLVSGSLIKTALGTEIEGTTQNGFKEAIKISKKADQIVLVLGEDSNMSGEAASRTNIKLPGNQEVLLKAVREANPTKKISVVLMNGRPLDLSGVEPFADAILEAWFPGTMGGAAIAELLYGDANPSAKLTTSFPRTIGQVPLYYNNKNTGRPIDPKNPKGDYRSHYIDELNSPLYPFGYGLSYTTFTYGELKMDKQSFKIGEDIKVSIDITNIGKVEGEEVVQLYINDQAASITRPIKELKGFEKIHLKAGETKTVNFILTSKDLSFWNQGIQKVEAGRFNVAIAPSSNFEFKNHFILE